MQGEVKAERVREGERKRENRIGKEGEERESEKKRGKAWRGRRRREANRE